MFYRKISNLFITIALIAFLGLTVSCSSDSNDDPADNSDNNGDTDGDGVPDFNDAFPNDPTETVDTDGDGTGDNADLDDDADGLPDDNDDNPLDTDNDGLPNAQDDDDDDDGVLDINDSFPLDQSESMDSDGDGIGDNADPDSGTGDMNGMNGTVVPITSGNNTCIIDTGADGNATFSGGAMWSNNTDDTNDLEVAYNIQDNTTACSGIGGSFPTAPSTSYTLGWQLPVEGEAIVNILLSVDNVADGMPVVVQNYTDNIISFSSPDVGVGGAGSWNYEGCSLDITAVETSATPMIAIVSGSLTCDADADPAQILTRPIPVPGTPDTSIRFTAPMVFRTVIALLG